MLAGMKIYAKRKLVMFASERIRIWLYILILFQFVKTGNRVGTVKFLCFESVE